MALAQRLEGFGIEPALAIDMGRLGANAGDFGKRLDQLGLDTGRVVGTYRALLPEDARRLGFLYADREFVLSWLNPLRSDLVEFGRACIDPAYRNGVVLMMLWRGMREFVERHGHQYVIGCCSLPAWPSPPNRKSRCRCDATRNPSPHSSAVAYSR